MSGKGRGRRGGKGESSDRREEVARIMKRYGEVRGRGGVKKRQREKGVSQKDEWQGRRKEQEGEMEQREEREGRHGKMERWESRGGKRERRSGKEGRVEEKEKEWQGGMGDRGRGGEGGKRQGRGEGLRMQCQGDMSIR